MIHVSTEMYIIFMYKNKVNYILVIKAQSKYLYKNYECN